LSYRADLADGIIPDAERVSITMAVVICAGG